MIQAVQVNSEQTDVCGLSKQVLSKRAYFSSRLSDDVS